VSRVTYEWVMSHIPAEEGANVVVCVCPEDRELGLVLRGMAYGVWCMLLLVVLNCLLIYVAVCYMLSDVGCVRLEDQMRGFVLRGMASVSGVCCVLHVDV